MPTFGVLISKISGNITNRFRVVQKVYVNSFLFLSLSGKYNTSTLILGTNASELVTGIESGL